MSEPENFLSRWSRRKREAADEPAEAKAAPVPTEPAPASEAAETTKPEQLDERRGEGGEPLFDPKTLPPIESITADTDIRPFLAPGVPSELARAALRRAWVADPKIRDFVGLAEYAWDFNAPGEMAGFGPLEMTDELRREVARLVGQSFQLQPAEASASASPAAQPAPVIRESAPEPPAAAAPAGSGFAEMQDQSAEESGKAPGRQALAPTSEPDVASQQEGGEDEHLPAASRRSHGGALPK